ncbi:hypothetical protein KKF34_16605 [Myxococcota bacterium]|nr:hypothetical protein [Myxococcota bacterium]MBU1379789.1 hypothetical protein [Myxococcota bacterium]MBU1498499.1 hypothetical protein [Myxococcota bacterium]
MKRNIFEKIEDVFVVCVCIAILFGQCSAHEYYAEARCENICKKSGGKFIKIALRGGNGQGSKSMAGCFCSLESGYYPGCKKSPDKEGHICGNKDMVFSPWFWLLRIAIAPILVFLILAGYMLIRKKLKDKKKYR